jgi:peptide-methionine (S)-S-oxide reductase
MTQSPERSTVKRILAPHTVAVLVFLAMAMVACQSVPPPAAATHLLPTPAVDVPPGQATSSVAVFAGGCFWGIQGVFQHVTGVTSAVSGYAGGDQKAAFYEIVSSGTTGHAESVQITFDPRLISYGQLLQIFFSVHDPTQLNQQGPDDGTQYRSAIFPTNAEQADVARAYIAQLDQTHFFAKAIVTTIETGRDFYPAESYHQDYLTRNPTSPYIVINDLPKIDELKNVFPGLYRTDPVLVAGMQSAP